MKIGIDIDDTCWNLVGCWLNEWNKKYGYENELILQEDIADWEIIKFIPHHKEEFWKILDDEEFWLQKVSVSTAISVKDIIRTIYQNPNYDVYFITDTKFHRASYKINCFLYAFPFVDAKDIIICANKSIVNVDVMVDDKFETCRNFDTKDKYTILTAQPWNEKEFEQYKQYTNKMHRCNSWTAIENQLASIYRDLNNKEN